MTASDGSSPRDRLLSGNGKESPMSVEMRANPGETGTEAVFSPLACPDLSDAVRKGREQAPQQRFQEGEREELPLSLPPSSEGRTGTAPVSGAVPELCSDHVRPMGEAGGALCWARPAVCTEDGISPCWSHTVPAVLRCSSGQWLFAGRTRCSAGLRC